MTGLALLPAPPAGSAGRHRRYRPSGRGHAVAPFFLAATLYFLIGGALSLLRLARLPGAPDLAGWHWPLLHLLLVGGATQLMIGAMAFFAVTLLRTDAPPAWLMRAQWLLINAGALALTGGALVGRPAVSTAGGIAVLAALVLLLATLAVLRRRSLVAPDATFVYYLAAIACLLVGVTLGILMVSGWFATLGLAYAPLRVAHLHLNLNGWVTLTIIGTMRFLFPTTLGVPARHLNPLWVEFWPLAGGVALTTLGWLVNVPALVGLGFTLQLIGTLAYAVAVVRQWRAAAGPPALSSAHLLAATGWLAAATVAGTLAIGAQRVDAALGASLLRAVVDAVFLGFIAQTIVGAWTHLFSVVAALPNGPLPPLDTPLRPRLRAILHGQARLQLALANGGVAAIVASGLLAPTAPGLASIAGMIGLAALAAVLALVGVKAARVVALVARVHWSARRAATPLDGPLNPDRG
jgi:nitrite reductase (NO-forming)